MLANRVSKPNKINTPQSISNVPTKLPKNSGQGNPIFSNRPAPRIAGNKNFCVPSDKKTTPTIKRELILLFLNYVYV